MNDGFATLDFNEGKEHRSYFALTMRSTHIFPWANQMNDSQRNGPVSAWKEQVSIPTYVVGRPDRNPVFLEKRVYQGSSGAVYPFPVIESVSDVKSPRAYDAIFLENEFLKIMILPELGGRVQMALDKTNNYHFVYYNRVIKPALVGLAGP